MMIKDIFEKFFSEKREDIIFYDICEDRIPAKDLKYEIESFAEELIGRNIVKKEEYVILQMANKKKFFKALITLFYVEAIPVILPICSSESSYEQLEKIMKEHPGMLVVADEEGAQNLAYFSKNSIQTFNVDQKDLHIKREERAFGVKDEAIIMYSSGSTAEPKGTILTKDNLLKTVESRSLEYQIKETDRFMTWMSLEHIVGMVDFLLLPFKNGCQCVYSEISAFLANPKEWFDILERYQITITVAPNFAYKYIADCVNEEDAWDLSHLRYMQNIGEPISRKVVADFLSIAKRFSVGEEVMAAAYGLSESSSGVIINKGKVLQLGIRPDLEIISCIDFDIEHFQYMREDLVCQGMPQTDTQMRIVDNEGRLLGECCIGNIELMGPSICKGYFNYKGEPVVKGGWLHTGDVGFILDRQLYVIGRKKDVVFSYGRNIYLRDIEHAVAKYFQLRSVACGENIAGQGESYIYLFIELEESKGDQMKHKIRHTILKELGIKIEEIHFMPKLSNTKAGKISKAEIMKKYMANKSPDTLNRLKGVLEEYCSEDISDDTLLFDIAEDSLKMFKLIGLIYKQFGIHLGILDLSRCETVKALGDYIAEMLSVTSSGQEAEKNKYGKTSIQEAYVLGRQQEFYGNTNMSHFYMEIKHCLEPETIESTIRMLIRRHEMLRTVYLSDTKTVFDETIADKFSLISIEAETDTLELHRRAAQEKVNPPGEWPLFEVTNYKVDTVNILAVDMDMLIADGMSMRILFHDFKALCNGQELREIDGTFDDYLTEYSKVKNSLKYKEDKQFWLDRKLAFPGSPQLPLRKAFNPQPNVFKRKEELFSVKEWEKLEQFAQLHDVTVSILLLTLYLRTIRRWSEGQNFAVNVTVMDRPEQIKDSKRMVGDFTKNVLFDYDQNQYRLVEELKHNKHKLYEYLDHIGFDGVEFIRELAKDKQDNKALMPVVFTSMLFEEDNAIDHERIKYYITQTSQVYLDCQIYRYRSQYAVVWDYLEKLFDHNMLSDMFTYFIRLIRYVINQKDIEAAPIGNEDKIKQYNQTAVPYHEMTIPAMLEQSFARYGGKPAISDGTITWTYDQLRLKTEGLKQQYERAGIKSLDPVIVLVEKNMESIAAITAIAWIGAVFIPVPKDYPAERVESIKKYAKARWVIHIRRDEIMRIKSLNQEKRTSAALCQPDDVAYIIFTSGSTGMPKGVAITHKGVMNTIIDITQRFSLSASDCILGLSALNFDLSIFDIFGSFYTGAMLAVIKVPRDEAEISSMLNQYPVTIWNSVPAIMKLYLDEIPSGYKNEQMKYIFLSGDWIGTELPDRIREVFVNARVISLGGATEASIWSIYYPVEEVRTEWNSIPYGYPLGNQKIYILNQEHKICPNQVVGEIYIGGEGVARGYVGDDEKTSQSFMEISPFGRLYKTGDYGKFGEDGYVIFLGRKDGQVKVNGYRIELGEIESILSRKPEIRSAIAAADNKNRLIAYYVGDKFEDTALKQYLEQYLPAYMIPYKFVNMDKLPLSSNGKLDRKALLQIPVETKFEHHERPLSSAEQTITNIWRLHLGVNHVGLNENFFALGGDSMTAQKIAQELSKQFSVKIPFVKIVDLGTVSSLADYVEEQLCIQENDNKVVEGQNQENTKLELDDEFEATNIQKAYLTGRNDSFELGRFNAHYYFEVTFPYEVADLEKSIRQLLERHEVLCSVFLKNGNQKILWDLPEYHVTVVTAESMADFHLKNEQIRNRLSHKNYDFSVWPLFTFEVLKNNDNKECILFGSMNLLICDGDSLRIFLKELADGIKGKQLPELNYSYREYLCALTDHRNLASYEQSKTYWLERLDDFPEFPRLPAKISMAQCKEYKIKRKSATIYKEEWKLFKEIAKKHEVSASSLLCAIYARVLAKWSNQKDLLLNMTAFERLNFHPDAGRILGDFTKILPLEVHIDSNDIWQNAKALQKEILDNLDHVDFDGTEIIRELSKKRNCIGKAIMPVVFTCVLFQSPENWFEQIGRLRYAVSQTPQVMLDNQILEMNQELYVSWDYVEDLFEPEVMTAIFEDFIWGIRNVGTREEFEIPSQVELEEIWNQYNGVTEPAAQDTLQAFFESQAGRVPDQTALLYKNETYTYGFLEKKANQVARYLCEQGICGANIRVGVSGERRPETIISILGILKTGAAYVPIDPGFPKERQEFILADSGCRCLLTGELYSTGELNRFDDTPIGIKSLPDSLAYIIYTSGSTGKPKGVMIQHLAACNTIVDLNNKIALNESDRLIGISSVCFDLSVYDIFATFCKGASLVLVEDPRDCSEIAALLDRYKVTIWNSVPVIFSMVTRHLTERKEPHKFGLRQVLLSGDWIPVDLWETARAVFGKMKMMSLGGATEASIWSIYYNIDAVEPGWKSIPYGMPLKNQTIYVLNFALELCPADVIGEIYIGGAGVAVGYCKEEEKSRNAFICHPKLGRIYKTGDMGILRKEGYIEFLGRADNQVKIRGYRVELGEIENAMNRVKGIKEAVVSFITGGAGNKQLAAYYVPDQDEIAVEVIKSSIGEFLPDYMIPQFFVPIQGVPLSANGKIDRSKLPVPNVQKRDDSEAVKVLNPMQNTLLNIWKKVFGTEDIHMTDDFYSLGGDSIILMRMLDEITLEGFDVVGIDEILEFDTVEKLAAHVSEALGE